MREQCSAYLDAQAQLAAKEEAAERKAQQEEQEAGAEKNRNSTGATKSGDAKCRRNSDWLWLFVIRNSFLRSH